MCRRLRTLIGGTVAVAATTDGDIELGIANLKRATLSAPPPGAGAASLWLVRFGISSRRELLYVNWRELEHVLVCGQAGGGVEIVLTSLAAALAERYMPQHLRLWTFAHPHTFPSVLGDLPQQQAGLVDPNRPDQVQPVLAQLEAELRRRMATLIPFHTRNRPPDRTLPDMVVLVDELADLQDQPVIDLLLTHGSAYGMHLLAGTTRAEAVYDDVLDRLSTRLVLRTPSDDVSLWQLGEAGAADLGRGELLMRLDGRNAIRMHGFRISEPHLTELITLLAEAATAGEPDITGSAATPSSPSSAQETNAGGIAEAGEPGTAGAASPRGRNPDAASTLTPSRDAAVVPEPGAGRPADPPDPAEASLPVIVQESARECRDDESQGRQDAAETGTASYLNGSSSTNGYVPAGPSCQPVPVEATAARTSVAHEQPEHTADAAGQDQAGSSISVRAVLSPDESLIQVCCFGTLTVSSGDRILTASGKRGAASYKAQELLAFLAAHPEGTVTNEKLCLALWPEADAESALNSKRVAMRRLRELMQRQVPGLPDRFVGITSGNVNQLDPKLVWSDVHEFLALCRAPVTSRADEGIRVLERARALYRGPLLIGDGLETYAWVTEHEVDQAPLWEQYRDAYYRVTQRLGRLYVEAGNIDAAILLYRSILKDEPTLEDVVRDLYQCYRLTGDLYMLKREHLNLIQSLRKAYAGLDDGETDMHDIQPEPETEALYREIRVELKVEGNGTAQNDAPAR